MSCYYYENTNTFSIHIPKCAGGSFDRFIKKSTLVNRSNIKNSYYEFGESHLTLKEFKTLMFKENPESYRSFTFVRNPYSRALSIYFWIVKNSSPRVLEKMGVEKNDSILKTSFFEFWDKYAFNEDRFTVLTRLQSDYIEENTIKFKIEDLPTQHVIDTRKIKDSINRCEQIKQIYKLMGLKIQKKGGWRDYLIINPINFEKQKVHVNKYDKKSIYKDTKNLHLIKEIYKKDFEYLDYSY
jgi:hypothetical protein